MSIFDLFSNGNKPNVLFIITDQERALQRWPASFMDNLPAMQQLMSTGLTFQRAFTPAAMCSPSRATFLTSQYPAQTGVTRTGTPEPPVALPAGITTLATVLQKAGYTCAWRGKWHLGGGSSSEPGPDSYGFTGWDTPDAGNSLAIDASLGGGTPDNDGRYLADILGFLQEQSASDPFCLVASFVNPHDVYVGQYGPGSSGYSTTDFNALPVPLPAGVDEDLSTKPRAQATMAWNNVKHTNTQQDYVNFYAWLQSLVDGQIQQVLNQLTTSGLLDNTLIVRFADHGEMGLSHGLVEKFYNAYDEVIHIPLVFSNPVAYPSAETTTSMASLLDLVPTMASLLGVSGDFTGFHGQDLTPILNAPSASVQNYVHFTYDDVPTAAGPSIVRALRTQAYLYAVYFTPSGDDADWELYDLVADPDEDHNVAGRRHTARSRPCSTSGSSSAWPACRRRPPSPGPRSRPRTAAAVPLRPRPMPGRVC
jgi:arylsulfatase A-like enzyme